MNIHLTSIIPLMLGLILLTIGLTFSTMIVVWISAVIITYGCMVHANNVLLIRKRAAIDQHIRRNFGYGSR